MKKIRLLNILINNLSQRELLEQIKEGVVFTPNVDHLIKLQNDREFLRVYSIADYKLCDSQILLYASKFLGNPIKEKVSGSDFFPAFYNYHKNNRSIKIFLLGAEKGVARQAQKNINKKVKRNIVVGAYSPTFGFEKTESECTKIVEMINISGATVLAIGVGAPKQEKWIYKYKHKLTNIKIFLAIGATIDFEAGNVKRAPKWVSNIGMEWLHRLLSEPKRLWRRYLIEDLPFFWLILKQKLNLYGPADHQKPFYPLKKPLVETGVFNDIQDSQRSARQFAVRGEPPHTTGFGGGSGCCFELAQNDKSLNFISKVKSSDILKRHDLNSSENGVKTTSSINLLGINSHSAKSNHNRKARPKS